MVFKRKNKKILSGFSMIEAVLAIFICGATLVVFLSVFSPLLMLEFSKRDQILAANLAQEGVEIMRNIRDNNLKGQNAGSVKNAFDGPFPSASGCLSSALNYDYNYQYGGSPLTVTPCVGESIYKPVAVNSPNPPIGFQRTIGIRISGDSRIVTSVVRWKPKGSTEWSYITVEDTLYSWGNH